jgi:hypothetical protein
MRLLPSDFNLIGNMETDTSRTIKNIRTEKRAKEYLVKLNEGFHEITKKARKQILSSLLEVSEFKACFDLVKLKHQRESPIETLSNKELNELELVEIKSSDRNLPLGLKGYYFSIQQREIDLVEKMPERIMFAFVVIPRNGANPFHEVLSWEDILKRTTARRIQININF